MNAALSPIRTAARRLARPLLYLAAFLLVPLLVGAVGLATRMSAPAHPAEPPALSQALPAAPTHDQSRKVAVVLSSAYGAEITDFLPPYEILARSGAFDVYALAPERKVLPLVNSGMQATSLDFVPHFSFAEYASAVGTRPDVIVVPWFPGYAPTRDAAVLDWIRANAGPQTTLVTICAGTEILADTGLMSGHTATTNVAWFGKLEPRFPDVTWVRNVRYYDDGRIITSSSLATGIDATLRAVMSLAGRPVAEDVARQLGYQNISYLTDPSFQPSMAFFGPVLANAAFQVGRQEMGVLLYDGVSEMALAGILDPYTASMVARAHVFGESRTAITSRNGLTFVPRDDFGSVRSLDRVVVPGGDATQALRRAVESWGRARPERPAEEIHQGVGTGESAYDATLKDMARTQNAATARAAGQGLFYPTDHLRFEGAAWPVAPVLTPLTLGALGVGIVYLITHRRSRPGQPQRQLPRAA